MKIIYSPKYNIDLQGHVFPTQKYDLIYKRLMPEYKDIIFESAPAQDNDIETVHTKEYVDKLRNNKLLATEIQKMELPYSNSLISSSSLCAGGTIMTYKAALQERCAIHIGGGFHHAMPDHGEGFCVLNDVAIGIRVIQQQKLAKTVLVLDCDLHQGNGTGVIFQNDKTVFTFSIHQENNYPIPKASGSMDIGLADGTGDEEYMLELKTHVPEVVEKFKPELIVYIAGADPYRDDKLGGLGLSKEGFGERDESIFSLDAPIAVLLAGGYSVDLNDTVDIHYNMVQKAINLHYGGN